MNHRSGTDRLGQFVLEFSRFSPAPRPASALREEGLSRSFFVHFISQTPRPIHDRSEMADAPRYRSRSTPRTWRRNFNRKERPDAPGLRNHGGQTPLQHRRLDLARDGRAREIPGPSLIAAFARALLSTWARIATFFPATACAEIGLEDAAGQFADRAPISR